MKKQSNPPPPEGVVKPPPPPMPPKPIKCLCKGFYRPIHCPVHMGIARKE